MKGNQMFDFEKFNFTIARLKKQGKIFEIVISDIEKALLYRNGSNIDILDVIQSEKIFYSANHGRLASTSELFDVFETDDQIKICEKILKEGDLHLSAEYKAKLREDKKKQIIFLIHKNSIDPRTDAPHTISRIESAIEEKKIKIDEFKPAIEQVKEVINKIHDILPLKFENKKYSIRIFSPNAEKGMIIVRKFTKPIDTSWMDDGSVVFIIEISPGVANDLIENLKNITKGGIHIEQFS